MRTRLGLSIAVALLAGCGDDARSDQPDAGVSLESAPAAYAAAYCERAVACCTVDELADLLPGASPPVTDRASCEAQVARVFGNEFLSDTSRAEAEGLADYSPEAMAACLEHIRADGCVHLARVLALTVFPEECAPVRIPQVSLDGACDHDFHCETGYCEGGGETTTGVCAELPVLDAACPDGRCVSGAYCDRSVDPGGICAPLLADGETCTSKFVCESFYCDGQPGVCAPPVTCDGT